MRSYVDVKAYQPDSMYNELKSALSIIITRRNINIQIYFLCPLDLLEINSFEFLANALTTVRTNDDT